jgi:plastocyanin
LKQASALVAAALSLTACGGSSSPAVAAHPLTYRVLVDGHTAANAAALSAFFPRVVRVHAGDTVVFHLMPSGLPHTVAFGTSVDKALGKIETLTRTDPQALDAGPPKEYLAIPQLLPQDSADADQAAAQPCVAAAGAALPADKACQNQSLDAYDGHQQLATSGWLAPTQDWSLRFATSTKPGTYRFVCQVHGPDMAGAVQVEPAATAVKDPAAVEAEGLAARDALLQGVQPGFELLKQATAGHALAGSGDPGAPSALITAFGPRDVTVVVGHPVAWTVIGTHSLAFNAPQDARGLRQEGQAGAVHISPKASLPAGGKGAGPAVPEPPSVIDGGRWSGKGFRSSGLIFGPPPPHTTSFRLTFTKPGRYTLVCLVHPDMTGSVTVKAR